MMKRNSSGLFVKRDVSKRDKEIGLNEFQWRNVSARYKKDEREERVKNKLAYVNEYKELPPSNLDFWRKVEQKQRERPGSHATAIAHDLLHQPPKRKKAMIPGNYKHIKRTTARAARSTFTNRGAMFDW